MSTLSLIFMACSASTLIGGLIVGRFGDGGIRALGLAAAVSWVLATGLFIAAAHVASARSPRIALSASPAAEKLAAPGANLIEVISSLSDEEFRDYFGDYTPPAQLDDPALCHAYALKAQHAATPPFRRRNTTLDALAAVYASRAVMLGSAPVEALLNPKGR